MRVDYNYLDHSSLEPTTCLMSRWVLSSSLLAVVIVVTRGLSMSAIQIFQPTRILSASATGDLLDSIDDCLEAGKTNILIDLQNVLFMDSSGLGALVIALKRVKAVNGRFALCCVNGQARMLLEQSGMEGVFEVYASSAEFSDVIAATAKS